MLLNIITMYIFIAALITTFLAFYLINNGKSEYSYALAFLMLLVFMYDFGYLAELNSHTVEAAIFWVDFEYIPIPLINSVWLVVSLLYLGKIKKFFSLTSFIFFILPFITILMRFTNDFHNGFYSDPHLVQLDNFWLINTTSGLGYYIHIVYVLVLTLAVIVMFVIEFVKSGPNEKRKYGAMLLASILPVIAVLIGLFDPFNLPLDYTALVLPISVFILAVSIILNDNLQLKSKVRFDLFQSSHDGIIVISNRNIVLDYNFEAEKFLNHHSVELNKNAINSEYTILNQNKDLQEVFNNNAGIFEYYSFEHDEYWEVKTRSIENNSGKVVGRLKIINQTTNKVKSRIELEKLSKTDELSSLNNRRELIDQGNNWLSSNHNEFYKLAVLFFDIDFFKVVNDTYGHAVGDDVIRNIGALLRKRFRSSDIVTRYGGEEFVVLIKIDSQSEALKLAQRTLSDVQEFSFIKEDPSFKLTISAGVAFADENDNLDALISKADKAMYKAKTTGRNRVVIYDKKNP